MVVSLAFSAANLLPTHFAIQEVNSAGSVYYLIAHCISLPLLFFLSRRVTIRYAKLMAALMILLSLSYIREIVPFYLHEVPASATAEAATKAKLRVFYANVETSNTNFAALRSAIDAAHPDLVALLELDETWSEKLALTKDYPYSKEILRADNFGLGIFSRYPLTVEPDQDLGYGMQPFLNTKVSVPEVGAVPVVLYHAIPPLSNSALYNDFVGVRRVSILMRDFEGPAILLTDLNATPFSSIYKRMMYAGKLESAMHGRGLWRTWNAKHSFMRLTLDHVLYKGNVEATSFERLPAFGSDHFPFLTDFSFN